VGSPSAYEPRAVACCRSGSQVGVDVTRRAERWWASFALARRDPEELLRQAHDTGQTAASGSNRAEPRAGRACKAARVNLQAVLERRVIVLPDAKGTVVAARAGRVTVKDERGVQHEVSTRAVDPE